MTPLRRPTKRDIDLYLSCMEQIKFRVNGINNALSHFGASAFGPLDAEFVALQLRKVFELIAYSSLCAHRQLFEGIRARIDREDKIAQILKTIKQHHPRFFPIPIRQQPSRTPGAAIEVVDQPSKSLTLDTLIQAHGNVADWLHSFNPYTTPLSPTEWHGRFRDLLLQTTALLGHHRIILIDHDVELWCLMHAQDGKVHAFEMQPMETPPAPQADDPT